MTGWNPYDPDPAVPPQPWGAGAGGVPPGGYLPPPQFGSQPEDPLVSPDYGGWWGRATTIVRRGWKPLAALQAIGLVLALLLQAPAGIWVALASDDLQRSFPEPGSGGQPDLTPFFVALGLTAGAALLGVLVTAMVTLAVVHVGVSVAIGAPARIDDALRLAARRIFPLIGWQLLSIPLYLVAVCLCILPVFYVAAVFTALPVVVAAERTGAFGRCFTLFHRNLGLSAARIATILGLSLAGGLIAAVFGGVIDAAASNVGSGNAGTIVGVVVSTLVTAVLGGALAILVAPLTLTAYADMRARVEPFNAMVIAQELGVVPPPTPWSDPWPPAAPA
ncbi:MAG TPA: hypothetical protein VK659_22630 [Asanoa sp.]|nr:hypothetical protein [Asanoa sp.]